jgi:hypothetical protein
MCRRHLLLSKRLRETSAGYARRLIPGINPGGGNCLYLLLLALLAPYLTMSQLASNVLS